MVETGPFRFQVGLSFPGTEMAFVDEVANGLAKMLVPDEIFFFPWYEAELARADLDVYLQEIYARQCQLIVPFFCHEYADRPWCNVEWRSMRNLLISDPDRLMPVRLDDSAISGFQDHDGFLNAINRSPDDVVECILDRLDQHSKHRQPRVVRSQTKVAKPDAPTDKARRGNASNTTSTSPQPPHQEVIASSIIGPVIQQTGDGSISIGNRNHFRWLVVVALLALIVASIAIYVFVVRDPLVDAPRFEPMQVVPLDEVPPMPTKFQKIKENLNREDPSYERSDVVIRNLTDVPISLCYAYTLRGVTNPSCADDFGIQASGYVPTNETDAHSIEFLAGPVFIHVNSSDTWHPLGWYDIKLLPVRYITVINREGQFDITVSATGPVTPN